tara:strand:- start:6426 stop:9221 length:2796 start_codon:yes stop_codon:yes gene_type:complete
MSVQLVLYPQNYQGYVATNTIVYANQVAQNIAPMFGLNLTTAGTAGVVSVINSSPPTTNWQRGRAAWQTTSNNPHNDFNFSAPVGWHLSFPGGGGALGQTYVYCKVQGLIPGQKYEVTMNVKQAQPHNADFNNLYIGTNGSAGLTDPVLGGSGIPAAYVPDTDTVGWTAPIEYTVTSTEETLILLWVSTATATEANELLIKEVVCRRLTQPVYSDGQLICDLYNDDTIPLTLSIDTFSKAAEKQQSYSKGFKLPATKHNNSIFENLFDLSRDSWATPVFNPYKQTRAVYKEDGNVIFQGYMRLLDVSEKAGEISYNVNLYSESVALATLMKAEKMSAIDFDELEHMYNKSSFFNSWAGTLTLNNPLPSGTFAGTPGSSVTNVLKYPNCNWNGQIFEVANQWMINNNANVGNPGIENLQTMFRPWIKIKYIIDRIFDRHGFTFSSAFFDSAYFGRLFMDFNWGKEINWAERGEIGRVDFASGTPAQNFAITSYTKVVLNQNNTFINAGYDITTGDFTAANGGMTYNMTAKIKLQNPGTITSTVSVYWRYTDTVASTTTSVDMQTIDIPAGQIRTFITVTDPTIPVNLNDEFCVVVYPATGDAALNLMPTLTSISGSTGGSVVVGGTLLNTQRGKLKQWDFFKGIMDMFNLVTLQDPDNPLHLIIEPYNDVFSEVNNFQIQTHDWTDKVDADVMKFNPMDLKRSTTFQYQVDKDYPFEIYKGATSGYNYGSLEWTVPGYTQVKGETKVEAKPFAATVMKPFFDSIPDWPGPCIYKGNADETAFEGFDNKPRILYDVTGDVGGGDTMPGGLTYYIPYQNGTFGSNATGYCLFSHVDAYPSTATDRDLNFGACQFINMGVPPTDNLFSRYYQDYYYELYHPDTKTVKLKVLLKPAEITNFMFWDKVRIKNVLYRVSKINYKPEQLSDVELILIGS